MYFKSKTQPYCRWCGKPIRKHTERHSLRGHNFETAEPVTVEELKKTTNKQIVSVKYHYEHEKWEDQRTDPSDIYSRNYVRHVSGRRTVSVYTTWDGETYLDEFFCNGPCENAMGRAAAEKGWSTKHWRERMKKEEAA